MAISQPILIEARRNVTENMGLTQLQRLHRLIADIPFELTSVPTGSAYDHCAQIAGDKDAHVLAAAVQSHAPYLLTLDRPLRDRINRANLPLRALTPGEFIGTLLPSHPDYPSIR